MNTEFILFKLLSDLYINSYMKDHKKRVYLWVSYELEKNKSVSILND